MSPENDSALCTDFPLLFAERKLSSKESCLGRGFECRDGWYPLIRELAEKLEAVLVTLPEGQRFTAAQVKEKFGILRFYTNGPVPDELRSLISKTERASAVICEVCGEPGSLKGGPWYQTLCAQHEQAYRDRLKEKGL